MDRIHEGNFAIVLHHGQPTCTIIDELTFFNGKLIEIRCVSLTRDWHRGYYPNQIISTHPNPDREAYLQQQEKDRGQSERYTKQTTKLVLFKEHNGQVYELD